MTSQASLLPEDRPGVWLVRRGGPALVRDGQGFGAPMRIVGQRRPRYFEKLTPAVAQGPRGEPSPEFAVLDEAAAKKALGALRKAASEPAVASLVEQALAAVSKARDLLERGEIAPELRRKLEGAAAELEAQTDAPSRTELTYALRRTQEALRLARAEEDLPPQTRIRHLAERAAEAERESRRLTAASSQATEEAQRAATEAELAAGLGRDPARLRRRAEAAQGEAGRLLEQAARLEGEASELRSKIQAIPPTDDDRAVAQRRGMDPEALSWGDRVLGVDGAYRARLADGRLLDLRRLAEVPPKREPEDARGQSLF